MFKTILELTLKRRAQTTRMESLLKIIFSSVWLKGGGKSKAERRTPYSRLNYWMISDK